MEEDQTGGDQGSPKLRRPAGCVIRVDQESHDILEAYRRWLEEREVERVSMAEAVRGLLVEKAKELMRNETLDSPTGCR